MNIFGKNIFKKLLPFEQATSKKPLTAGEVYYLWESLTGTYKLITIAEMYLMNTEDPELHAYLKALTSGAFLFRVSELENVLKGEGFTVPPRPSSKTLQGSPGSGQEVKLTDREVIKNLVGLAQTYVMFFVRAVTVSTNDSVRKLFKDLLGETIEVYKMALGLGKSRNVFDPPPPATARKDSLNMYEVGVIWDELTGRHSSQVNMETYLASTKDTQLNNLISWGLKEIVMPQMERLETILKKEGLTIPPRPVIRTNQYTPGQLNKIRASDDELLGVLTIAFQSAVNLHARALSVSLRDDILELFEGFLYKELEAYDKTIDLSKLRLTLDNPPVVSSLRI
ncbi:hypothetical protein DCCM_4211 [Desulfocucumis palustris]|uniref:DUF3231 family protein n=1 Tax=Desulfocucumis palustris TaxID=1898651 RepID=A0A2L2XFS0_9FIRM|nr:DUF3231 family protein [Desulfocucumis palustris]GBF35088.1 hypothetical protein DCCM_4211 [Desulfocucumis palustris]